MTTVAIDDIWQAILESERSDDIQFIDDELHVNAEAARLTQLLRIQSAAAGDESAVKMIVMPVPGR